MMILSSITDRLNVPSMPEEIWCRCVGATGIRQACRKEVDKGSSLAMLLLSFSRVLAVYHLISIISLWVLHLSFRTTLLALLLFVLNSEARTLAIMTSHSYPPCDNPSLSTSHFYQRCHTTLKVALVCCPIGMITSFLIGFYASYKWARRGPPTISAQERNGYIELGRMKERNRLADPAHQQSDSQGRSVRIQREIDDGEEIA